MNLRFRRTKSSLACFDAMQSCGTSVGGLGSRGSRQISDGQREVRSVLGQETSKGDVEGDEGSDDTESASSGVDGSLSGEFAAHAVEMRKEVNCQP
jgi:hypothetical protein